jgi:ABC-2 type transport system ATP-binding protein
LHQVPTADRERRKEELLGFSRLSPFVHRLADRLSGGMKKKLALCCALVHSPEILFMDEPTTGVDPVSRRDFWKILYNFLAEGITIFVSTPYMDEAERCNRVALMDKGRIIKCDTPANLKQAMPGHLLEIRARPQRRAVELLEASPGARQVQILGQNIHLLLDNLDKWPGELEPLLAQEGVQVEATQDIAPSLEDVFVAAITEAGGEEATRWAEGAELSSEPGAPLPLKEEPGGDKVTVAVSDLTKRFDSFTAVDGVSFKVREGEIFGFLGPNGAGKSTVIRILCGLLPPTSGGGTILGHDIIASAQRIKPRIGYMSQKFSLYNDLTVEENIEFFAGVYGVKEKDLASRKNWVLEMAGLKGKEKHLTKDLSGGWKQRLALGCAVIHQPQVIFLDEPTAGVDPISRRYFWDLIYGLGARGVTVFVTTHYMDEADHCHTLGLIYQGQLIALGSPQDLRESKAAGEVLEVECSDLVMGLDTLSGLPFSSQVYLYANTLHVLVDESQEAAPMIRRALEEAGIEVSSMRQVPLTTEDVFVSLIEAENGRQPVGRGVA